MFSFCHFAVPAEAYALPDKGSVKGGWKNGNQALSKRLSCLSLFDAARGVNEKRCAGEPLWMASAHAVATGAF